MFLWKVCKFWIKLIPWFTLLGGLTTGVGIILLVKCRDDLIETVNGITTTFFDERGSSLLKGNHTFWILTHSFLALSVVAIFMGFMSKFRSRLFGTRIGRVLGAIICTLLICFSIALIWGWIHHAEFYSKYYFLAKSWEIECILYPSRWVNKWCMFLSPANILLDINKLKDFKLCNLLKWEFCNKYQPMYKKKFLKLYMCFCAIIIGQVIYCMCLAADFVKIRRQTKVQELEQRRGVDASSKDIF